MMNINKSQNIQEEQYKFPYHYLIEYVDENRISCNKKFGWAFSYLGRIYLVDKELREIPFKNLLDIGCGDGKLLNILSGRYPNQNYAGIDISMRAIKFAKILNSDRKNLIFHCGDIYHYFDKEHFDIISMIEVLEHIPKSEVRRFVISAVNLLSKGGYLIGTVPSDRVPVIKKHFQHFNIKRLKDLFNSVKDITIVDMHYIDYQPFWLKTLIKCAIKINDAKLQNIIFSIYKNHSIHPVRTGEGLYFKLQKNQPNN